MPSLGGLASLRFGRSSFDQAGDVVLPSSCGRSTLALSLRMMENISIPVEEPLQNRLEFENAAVSQPGGFWRGTGTVAHCRNGYRIRGNHAFKSPIRFLIARSAALQRRASGRARRDEPANATALDASESEHRSKRLTKPSL